MRSFRTPVAWFCAMTVLVVLAGCGGEEEIVNSPPPSGLKFDPSVRAAGESPRFEPFRRLVQARIEAVRALRRYRSPGPGLTPNGKNRPSIEELSERVQACTANINRALADTGITPEDRKIMRAIITDMEQDASRADDPGET